MFKLNQYILSTIVWLLCSALAHGAAYKPLPDMVPARDAATESDQTVTQPVVTPAQEKKVTTSKQKAKRKKRRAYRGPKVVQPFNQEIRLFAGETRVLREPNAGRLAVGKGEVLSAAVLDDKEILLIANDIGISSLHIWTKSGKNRRVKVTVVPNNTQQVSREIATFLSKIPNAKASIVGANVVVEGENMSDRDLAKVAQLAETYPQIINFTNQQGWEKMIAMDVRVVEFPTAFLREVGIKWGATGGGAVGAIGQLGRRGTRPLGGLTINQISPNDAPAPIIESGTGNGLIIPSSLNVASVLNAGFNAQLNMMEENGSATVLARPTLSTRSGTKAKFLAGGEVPYSATSFAGTTILFKEYGISLEIEPTANSAGVIRAKIKSEVSEIDPALSVPGGPALLTRMTESEFNVKSGETIVLSGLLKKSKTTNVDKLPFLGDIPILGALFRSKRYQEDQTELVVFVTPTATDKHTEKQDEDMREADKRVSNVVNGRQNRNNRQLEKAHQKGKDTYPEVMVPEAVSSTNNIGPKTIWVPANTYRK